MLLTPGKSSRYMTVALVALGISALTAMPSMAHGRNHHVKHVNVKINLGGGNGHHYYRPVPVVYVAPVVRSCTRWRKDGWFRGHSALVSNRVCFDVYGNPIVQPGTKRLVHYY